MRMLAPKRTIGPVHANERVIPIILFKARVCYLLESSWARRGVEKQGQRRRVSRCEFSFATDDKRHEGENKYSLSCFVGD